MTIYYRDDALRVNSTTIQSYGRVYPLDELDDVWLERGPLHADRLLGVLLMRLLVGVAGAVFVGAIVAVVIDVHHPAGDLVPAWVVYGYLFGSPIVFGVLIRSAERAGDRGSRTMLLCASWRGENVTLFATTDSTRFGQVHRAVLRALEHSGR